MQQLVCFATIQVTCNSFVLCHHPSELQWLLLVLLLYNSCWFQLVSDRVHLLYHEVVWHIRILIAAHATHRLQQLLHKCTLSPWQAYAAKC